MRLLVVEDDVKMVRALERGLQAEGYAVDVVGDGYEALEHAHHQHYDAVVLDLMIPGQNGLAVCTELRRADEWLPVLMVTARGDVRDRLRGFEAGADDYLVKPFAFDELLARLRAMLRRGHHAGAAVLEVGDLRIELVSRTVARAGRVIELSPREFRLLEFLARRAGHAVSRAQLLEHVWADSGGASLNVVDVYVGYLRRKLEHDGAPRLLHTVRGVGFMLEAR